ncbi:hypothetical protein TNCV_2225781 [Trichonephila clavipes]|nr:hypothetical protein TNCV_2225781 [Trichonephila clavipes]
MPCWSTRRVAGQVDRSECAVRNCGSSGHEKIPTRGKPGRSDQKDHEERGIEGSCGKHLGGYSDSFNDTSRRRRSNCSTNNFRHLQKKILNPSAPSRHSL